jgi:hypothetical protein
MEETRELAECYVPIGRKQWCQFHCPAFHPPHFTAKKSEKTSTFGRHSHGKKIHSGV